MRKITIKQKILPLFISFIMVFSLFSFMPMTTYAATGMATIDISTLGGADDDNDSDLETESNWYYDKTAKFLVLNTEGGKYTLTGTNTNLNVLVNSTNINVTLNGVNITGPSGTNAFGIGNGNSCTMNLISNNTLTGNGHSGINTGNNSECVITSSNSGSLNVNTILLSNNVDLRITGNADVKSIGTGVFDGISVYSTNSIFIGDNAKLTFGFVGGGGVSETHTFTKADAGTTHKWKLTDATTIDEMTDDSITVKVTAGTPGTVEREPIVSPPVTTKYSVTFSGAGNIPPQSIEHGKTIVKPADPKKPGYTFIGWHANNNFTSKFDFNTKITQHTTVYAYFAKNPAKSKILKATSPKKKQIKASWKKISGTSYEVLYSTNKAKLKKADKAGSTVKKFYTGNKTKYTLKKGLKSKKTYYLKVRAYKVVDGIKVYGEWSAVKAGKKVK